MDVVLAILCLVIGGVIWAGQVVGAVNFPLAQRLGWLEKDAVTDAPFRRAEQNTARWDVLILWPMPVTGILLLLGHPWWPLLGVISGAIYLDTAGREAARCRSFAREGIKIGSPADIRKANAALVVMAALGVWLMAVSVVAAWG